MVDKDNSTKAGDLAAKLALDKARSTSHTAMLEKVRPIADAMAEILIANPDLTMKGFDPTGDPLRPTLDELYLACEFLDRHFSYRRGRPFESTGRGSYFLKHQVEAFARYHREPIYCPNGLLILAALFSGYNVRRDDRGPNALIGGYLRRRGKAF